MPTKQLVQGLLVARFEPQEQVVIVAQILVVHGCPHFKLTAAGFVCPQTILIFEILLRMQAVPRGPTDLHSS